MLTQTIINPPFFIASGRLTQSWFQGTAPFIPVFLAQSSCPTPDFTFFLPSLLWLPAMCSVFPGQHRLLLRVLHCILHPASCILHPTSCILHPALGLGMEAVGEPTPRAQHLLQVTAWSCQCRNFWLLWCKNNQKGPKECHEFRVRFKGALLLPPLLYQALTAH